MLVCALVRKPSLRQWLWRSTRRKSRKSRSGTQAGKLSHSHFANRSRCWRAVLDPSECDRRRGECITSIDTGRFRPVAMSRNSSRSSDNPRSRQETLPSDCTSVEKVSCPTSMARCGMSCATKGIQRRSVASVNRLISLAPSFREVGCPGIRRARPDSKHDLRFRRIKRLVS